VTTPSSPPPLPIHRRIALAAPAGDAELATVAAADGILGLTAARGGTVLDLRYDLHRLGLVQVVAVLRAAGLTPSRRVWARLARFWGGFRDDNLRQQAKIVHHCCSDGIPDRH